MINIVREMGEIESLFIVNYLMILIIYYINY